MMNYQPYLEVAETAARSAGNILRRAFAEGAEARAVSAEAAHDLKLRLDEELQSHITAILLAAFPETSLLGEEGDAGAADSSLCWVVDPLDGTVNFFYGLPIFCVSIALQHAGRTVLGCVYDPMQQECYTAVLGDAPRCNGQFIAVSNRTRMAEAVVFVGHGTHDGSGAAGLHRFGYISSRVRKMRILGSAALSLCYIAAGRMDAYVEDRISLWDFAAAGFILEMAGGVLEYTPHEASGRKGAVLAWNGRIPLKEQLLNSTLTSSV